MSSADVVQTLPVLDESSIQKIQSLWKNWDDLVRPAVFNTLRNLGFVELSHPSPITKDLPFMSSPTPLITAILAYLLAISVGLITHKFKKNAGEAQKKGDAVWLRFLVQCHNLFLIVLSAYMSSQAVFQALKLKYTFWGNGYKVEETDMAKLIYVFFVSKIYEFFDTVIMLMKGNIHQVSFLHVYHHVSISFIWWSIALVAPGGDAWYSCALNSLVHVIMYTYYFLAALIGKNEKKRKKYLWWGRYMTMFQMTQFVTMMAQAAYCYYNSPYPKFLSALLFWYMQTLLALFMNFFVQKYVKGSRKARKPKRS